MMFKIFIVFVVWTKIVCAQDVVRIGAIFYEDSKDMQVSLNMTAKSYEFETSVKTISKSDDLVELYGIVCSLAQEGVVAIIDGIGGRASEAIQAVSDIIEIPHVALQHNDLYTPHWSILNLYPSASAYNMLLESLITYKNWDKFTVFYVKGYSIAKVSNLLKMENSTDRNTVTLRELSGLDYRDVLIAAKESGFTKFVVDCPSKNLRQFLMHAQQVGLMSEEHSYIFLSPDLFTLDLSDYRYGGVNITGFRLVDLKNSDALWNFTANFNNETGPPMLPEELKTEVVLVHDAVNIIAQALKKVVAPAKEVSCENYESWMYGSSVLNFMKTNKLKGLTRSLNFDGTGQRADITMEILELTPSGNQTIGLWDHNTLTISRPFVPSAEITEALVMRNKTFKVLIAMTPPHGYVKESAMKLEGNDRYEGFAVDLFEELSTILGFVFELKQENDYGKYDNETGKWTGMVREIQEEKADFAICDFTITAQRKSALDFSTPFMTLGIGILYKEPSKQPPEMFSFMAVFSNEVWLYMLFSQIGLGVVMVFVGRISHKEWQNPVPCIEQPEDLTNQFSFANSIWLIIGSVMQQGTEIAPIAIAPRLITSVWWFFTMVMVASYTGTLVAFLTVEKDVLPFQNAEELYRQNVIAYGAKESGSTIQFFRDSENKMYSDMYKKMRAHEGWLVKDNDIAVEKAENNKYAAFMESTTIEYYKERHCDLLQVGQLLDTKSYGIGMKKGSEYRKYIDQALLSLKERGVIQKLKDLWWKEKRGGGNCEKSKNDETKQLDMKNMIGAFVVLGVGCVVGLFISILDMLWGVFKKSIKYNTTFKEELIEELLFIVRFSGDVKPVKRRPDKGSTEALSTADAEARDEVRSMRSIRSSDTHRTHHSHSSRHSSRSQSVAFARMRKYS